MMCLLLHLYAPAAPAAVNEVLIFMGKDDVPADAKLMGTIKISDNGFKINCGYERTMAAARNKALDKGATLSA